ncbi:hypothetical protein D3C80_1255830 [compost metagenome]
MVTISVPRKRLSPIFRFGFFISPAIKVTLFQASLLKTEPTIAAAIPPSKAVPAIGATLNPPATLQLSTNEAFVAIQALVQLAFHTSGLNMTKPATIKPKSASNLVEVKMF